MGAAAAAARLSRGAAAAAGAEPAKPGRESFGPAKRGRRRLWLRPAVAALLLAACGAGSGAAPRPITLAATTTVEDAGLLAALVEAFRAAHPEVRLRTVTGGTGQMLALAQRGDVDVVLSHDPAAESAFVAAGHGIGRREVMHNDFVIAGPPADPARVRGMRDAAAALAAIADAGAPFVSRGDDSGTHRKERTLWSEAGVRPSTRPAAGDAAGRWYIEAGLGMGDALRLADARRAYILTDRATFRVLRDALDLTILVEGDPRLVNRYGVVRVRGAPGADGAAVFVDWLTSEAGRRVIDAFGRDRYGRPLYTPSGSGG
ncbi:MAG TPA: substrate-binding domain-containing protein [Longimicrobiales bacterium]